MNPKNFLKLKTTIFKLFWWCIVAIYSVAYALYMPQSSFGNSDFTFFLWAINYLAGMFIIMRTGGLVK